MHIDISIYPHTFATFVFFSKFQSATFCSWRWVLSYGHTLDCTFMPILAFLYMCMSLDKLYMVWTFRANIVKRNKFFLCVSAGNIKNITIMMYRDCRVHCEETFSFSLKLLHWNSPVLSLPELSFFFF